MWEIAHIRPPPQANTAARVPAITMEINRRLYLKPASRVCYRLGNMPPRLGAFGAVKHDIWLVLPGLCSVTGCNIGQAGRQRFLPS